jgi:antitoxin YefM
MAMRILPLAEVKNSLSAWIDEIVTTHEVVRVTRNGRPAVVMLADDEYESLMETLDILSDPETMAAIAEGVADIAAGRVYTHDEVMAELRRVGRA